MDDYIRRKDALKAIESCAGWSRPLESAYEDIQAMPAADVAPVIRCEECRYYQNAKINKKGF